MEKIEFKPNSLSALLTQSKIDLKKVKSLNPASYSVHTTAKKVMYFSFYSESGEFLAQFAENGTETTASAKTYYLKKQKDANIKYEKKRDEAAAKKREEKRKELEQQFAVHNAVLALVKDGHVAVAAFNSMKPKKLQEAISTKIPADLKDRFNETPFAEISAYVAKNI